MSYDHDHPGADPADFELAVLTSDGRTVAVSAVGGGTIGRTYGDNAWHYLIRGADGETWAIGSDLVSGGYPISHLEAARSLLDFLAPDDGSFEEITEGDGFTLNRGSYGADVFILPDPATVPGDAPRPAVLRWTDYVANDWEELYPSLPHALARLAVLEHVVSHPEGGAVFADPEPDRFAELADTFLESATEV